jgi:hypothetical protein
MDPYRSLSTSRRFSSTVISFCRLPSILSCTATIHPAASVSQHQGDTEQGVR